jgi:hypothetical protein
LAAFGASWLGWDVATGKHVTQFDLAGLPEITETPRKYGFHGTLKPPFRLAEGQTAHALEGAVAEMAASLAPGKCDRLEVATLGRFLALTPQGDVGSLRRVAETCVRAVDPFRAPATQAELARRRQARLSARQDALLVQWGYPHVMEEFRFHMTLSGRLPKGDISAWAEKVKDQLPTLPAPFVFDQIALCGEPRDGQFELIHRYDLTG